MLSKCSFKGSNVQSKLRERRTTKLLKQLQFKSYSEVLLVLEKQIGAANPATSSMVNIRLVDSSRKL